MKTEPLYGRISYDFKFTWDSREESCCLGFEARWIGFVREECGVVSLDFVYEDGRYRISSSPIELLSGHSSYSDKPFFGFGLGEFHRWKIGKRKFFLESQVCDWLNWAGHSGSYTFSNLGKFSSSAPTREQHANGLIQRRPIDPESASAPFLDSSLRADNSAIKSALERLSRKNPNGGVFNLRSSFFRWLLTIGKAITGNFRMKSRYVCLSFDWNRSNHGGEQTLPPKAQAKVHILY